MVSTDFVNHLKPRRVEFFQCIIKNIFSFSYLGAFNEKSENRNSNNFQMIFALSANVFMRRSVVIVQQYFNKFCKNYVVFEQGCFT